MNFKWKLLEMFSMSKERKQRCGENKNVENFGLCKLRRKMFCNNQCKHDGKILR